MTADSFTIDVSGIVSNENIAYIYAGFIFFISLSVGQTRPCKYRQNNQQKTNNSAILIKLFCVKYEFVMILPSQY
jgi:hypothetical protein